MTCRLMSGMLLAAVLAAGLTGVSTTQATTYYWDGDGVAPVGGASGTWDTAATNWNASATGGPPASQAWVNNAPPDDAIFQNTPGVVGIGAPVRAAQVRR